MNLERLDQLAAAQPWFFARPFNREQAGCRLRVDRRSVTVAPKTALFVPPPDLDASNQWAESKEFVKGGGFSAVYTPPVPDTRQTSSFGAAVACLPSGTANALSMTPWRSPLVCHISVFLLWVVVLGRPLAARANERRDVMKPSLVAALGAGMALPAVGLFYRYRRDFAEARARGVERAAS